VRKLVVAIALVVAIVGATTAWGESITNGYCGFAHIQESGSCQGGEWIVCTTTFSSMATSRGWICIVHTGCKAVASCEDVASK